MAYALLRCGHLYDQHGTQLGIDRDKEELANGHLMMQLWPRECLLNQYVEAKAQGHGAHAETIERYLGITPDSPLRICAVCLGNADWSVEELVKSLQDDLITKKTQLTSLLEYAEEHEGIGYGMMRRILGLP